MLRHAASSGTSIMIEAGLHLPSKLSSAMPTNLRLSQLEPKFFAADRPCRNEHNIGLRPHARVTGGQNWLWFHTCHLLTHRECVRESTRKKERKKELKVLSQHAKVLLNMRKCARPGRTFKILVIKKMLFLHITSTRHHH